MAATGEADASQITDGEKAASGRRRRGVRKTAYNAGFTVVLCAVSSGAVTFARLRWEPLYELNKQGARLAAVVEAFGLADDVSDDIPAAAALFRDHITETTKKGVTTFTAKKDGRVLGHAIEFKGKGYEGPIHGILASDAAKLKALGFRVYHQEETPGLGGRCQERAFMDRFIGKSLVRPDGELGLRIVKHATQPWEIDAMTGVTMTSQALDRILANALTEFVSGEKLVPVAIELPERAYGGAPDVPAGSTAEAFSAVRRPTFMAPEKTRLVSRGKPVTSDEEEPLMGELKQITDGEKAATDDGCVELGFGVQYVQIDLGESYEVYGVVMWHDHREPHVYKDVVVQVADDPDFAGNVGNVETVFNNDGDNSADLGAGGDAEYFETFEGKLVKVGGVKGRYVRAYSNGNFKDEINRYTEIDVYGRLPPGRGVAGEGAEDGT